MRKSSLSPFSCCRYLIRVLLLVICSSCVNNSGEILVKLEELQKSNKWQIVLNTGDRLQAFSFGGENKDIFTGKDGFIDCLSLANDGGIVISMSKVKKDLSDVYVMNTDGTGITKLFSHYLIKGISISPDGKKIAFWSEGDAEKHSKNLFLYYVDTKETKLLLNNATYSGTAFSPSWSPDSRELVYAALDGYITVINIDNSSVTKILKGDAPTWSPDGGTIIYRKGFSSYKESLDKRTTNYFTNGFKYYSINTNSGDQKFIFNGKTACFNVGGDTYAPVIWSPNGRYILFTKGLEGDALIYAMELDSKKIAFVKKVPGMYGIVWK